VVLNTSMPREIARRYRGRGCDLEDLEQTACVALVSALRRSDPTGGHDFLSYAVPSIRGEVRRYFRDFGWMVRPPRSVQELQPRINAELAAMQAQGCFTPPRWIPRCPRRRARRSATYSWSRRIVHLRFVEELTQAEIADRLGLTQSQVSAPCSGSLSSYVTG